METLQDKLNGFYGTEHYYKLNPFVNIVATDGVYFFAKEGKALWAVDEMTLTAKDLNQAFISVTITCKERKDKHGNTCDIIFTDGNYNILKEKPIPHTDLEVGEYKFYITDNVILLSSEY